MRQPSLISRTTGSTLSPASPMSRRWRRPMPRSTSRALTTRCGCIVRFEWTSGCCSIVSAPAEPRAAGSRSAGSIRRAATWWPARRRNASSPRSLEGAVMNLDHVRQLTFAPILQRYNIRDSALYALSLGIGADPLDEDELPFVYEGRGPLAVPSQCVTLCWPPFWHKEPETGISWRRILHGEQSFSLLRPLAVKGAVRAEHSILAVDDKGAERGVIVYTAHDLFDELTGEPLAHLRSAEFLRDDGGCGGFGAAPKLTRPLENCTEPSAICDFRT